MSNAVVFLPGGLPLTLNNGQVLAQTSGGSTLASLTAGGTPFGLPYGPVATRTPTTQPTWADVVALHAEMLVDPWTAGRNVAYGSSVNSDVVVFLHGGNYLWFSEVTINPAFLGNSEPTWTNSPNPGDTIVDGDVTWTNGGLWSAWPTTVVTWQANHLYTMPVLIRPTTPNGHLYTPYATYTSGGSEPTWPTTWPGFVADGGGFVMNLGTQGSNLYGASTTPLMFGGAESIITPDSNDYTVPIDQLNSGSVFLVHSFGGGATTVRIPVIAGRVVYFVAEGDTGAITLVSDGSGAPTIGTLRSGLADAYTAICVNDSAGGYEWFAVSAIKP